MGQLNLCVESSICALYRLYNPPSQGCVCFFVPPLRVRMYPLTLSRLTYRMDVHIRECVCDVTTWLERNLVGYGRKLIEDGVISHYTRPTPGPPAPFTLGASNVCLVGKNPTCSVGMRGPMVIQLRPPQTEYTPPRFPHCRQDVLDTFSLPSFGHPRERFRFLLKAWAKTFFVWRTTRKQ